ncbi:aspartate kinase [Tuwongella immobilis]|uniref:aspartate kinase n=1 Tax=Tuwongella immobilis TaxID=692036 RepID=A0A6C2YT28_9BACT|nr:aspartate kinase [Tuwongella immobilis]VIP04541.1 aspartate kinase : Aspartokinase OS=Singulisphaera acidiphila (strain ATCC BAA-1392 / DSM 18658 / VKM B-2454 / MOB10) GN=Sinac_5942 PE=3 SV=1: AA_kinase: ACT: ACT_7: ACT_7 [Tuwongella immobilis]VTS06443.1 aspartate kinase : Aspartokinase OS=Singulisphaera acidiphila (strain ATCC BAA-1392 / DSM 18658 / VKM B-2454 / MOB10) GN=Sinac_5942 PE=3 SV=1: AA_kinase: ACT: ACT_7: ACT_7 [Tuwongella immobilis]
MPVVVQKFGGSSVATAERIRAAARRAIRAKQAGNQVVVVVSARGDTTDDLIQLAHEISEQPPAREMDMLLATGEQISIALMAMAIQSMGEPAISFTGAQIGIRTDSFHTKARIREISTTRIREALRKGEIVIVAGFQGIDDLNNITTLGRGGSDTTAVALAAALKHDPTTSDPTERAVGCEIYTDVDGVYTTDPRLVPEAHKIDEISYDEMLELASMGAGVMHSRSIEFAKKFDVPLMVRSSFSDAIGTWIVPEAPWMLGVSVCGAAIAKDEARILLDGLPDRPGVSHRIFSTLAQVNIAVDMIAQSLGEAGKAAIGFTVMRNEMSLATAKLQPLIAELGGTIRTVEDVSKVSIVGTGMRTTTGVAEKMFAALGQEGVNIKMITTGDIKISVLVDKAEGAKALRAVHQAFKLSENRPGAGAPTSENAAPFSLSDAMNPSSKGAATQTTQLIMQRLSSMEAIVVSGVELTVEQSRITIHDLPDRPGHCSRVFEAVAQSGAVVDMIVQNLTGSDRAELSFSVPNSDLLAALDSTRNAVRDIEVTARVTGDADMAVLFVHGVGMRTHTGVAEKMFGALAAQGINIKLINTSEVCISVVIEQAQGSQALAALKACFNLA